MAAGSATNSACCPSGHARASGITYCDSSNAGAAWTCGPPVDSVFDGPVFFDDETSGWVGGGEISPDVAGWVHRTTDGGATWSDRTLDTPWPIREILFVTPDMGWAAGGNIYSGAGGLYFSNDGGADLDARSRQRGQRDGRVRARRHARLVRGLRCVVQRRRLYARSQRRDTIFADGLISRRSGASATRSLRRVAPSPPYEAFVAMRQMPPPHRYCQAIPTTSKLLPVRADTPLLA